MQCNLMFTMHAGVLPASWGSVDAFPELTSLTISNTNITGSLSTQTRQIPAVLVTCLRISSCHQQLYVLQQCGQCY